MSSEMSMFDALGNTLVIERLNASVRSSASSAASKTNDLMVYLDQKTVAVASQKLTGRELIFKWSLKLGTMAVAVLCSLLLAALFGVISAATHSPSFFTEYLNQAFSMSLTFIPLMKTLEKIDKYFQDRAENRYWTHVTARNLDSNRVQAVG